MKTSSRLQTADFLLHPHLVGGAREFCGVFFFLIRALIPFMSNPTNVEGFWHFSRSKVYIPYRWIYGRSEIGPISGFRPQETGSFYFLSLEILILGMQPTCVRKPADPRRGTRGKTLVSCSWQPAPICQSCEWAFWKWVFQPHSSCPMWKRDKSSLQSSAQIVNLWVNKWLLLMQATKFCFVLVLVVVGVTKQKITLTSIFTKTVCNKPPKTSWASNSSPLFSQIFSSPTPAPLHVHSFWGTSMRDYTPWDKLFSWNGRVIRGQARHTRLLKVQAQNRSLLFLPTCLWSKQVT